jgi:hypothetical protein
MSTLSEKLSQYSRGSGLVEDIKRECNLSTIKKIIEKYIPIPRKFNDDVVDELVQKYKNVGTSDCVRLHQFLVTQRTPVKKNQFDAATFQGDSHVSITVGDGIVAFTDEHKKTVMQRCNNGVVGSVSSGDSFATIMSVGTKYVENTKVKANKVLRYNINNEFAPSEALTVMATSFSSIKNVTPTQLVTAANDFSSLSGKEKDVIKEELNALIPLTKSKDGVQVPIIKFESNKIVHMASEYAPTAVEGDLSKVAPIYERYKMGLGSQAMKRIGKNVWTGTPIDSMKVDHVISLHEAGVKPGSSVLVVTADTNMISLLRSNFGPQVYGFGNGQNGTIDKLLASQYKFDYVYYPKPIGFNTSGAFSDNVKQSLQSIRKKMDIYSTGVPIFYINPLLFYCSEIAAIFGQEVKNKSELIGNLKVYPAPAEYKEEVKRFTPIEYSDFPITQPERIYENKVVAAKHYHDNPSLVNKLLDLNKEVYECMMWNQMSAHKYPCKIANMSWDGYVMYTPNLPKIPIGLAIGGVIGTMRHTFKSIWYMKPLSKNMYTINRIMKGAIVEGLEWSDDWSAMYSTDTQKTFELDNTEKVSNIIIEPNKKEELKKDDEVVEVEDGNKNLDSEEVDLSSIFDRTSNI